MLELRSVLATVVGFPGVGKSRLALEFTESIAGEVRVLAGHCRSYGEGITYWPVAEIVRAAVGDDLRRGLANALEGEPDADRVADSVAGLLGEEHAVGTADEAFWALRRLFEALAAERPLILVFEDIHWAEPTLLDLIEYLADRIHGQSVLLLCLARPELLDNHPAWGASRANVVSLVLGSLSESESNLMLDERLEGRTIAPDVRARITTSAQGVPLFLEQMLAMLKERETVGVDDVPPVISALLAARLE